MTAPKFQWEQGYRYAAIGRPAKKLVGYVLFGFADKNGGSIWPSGAELAAACGMGRKAADKYRRELIADGWFEKVASPVPNRRGMELRLRVPETFERAKVSVSPVTHSSDRASGSFSKVSGSFSHVSVSPVTHKEANERGHLKEITLEEDPWEGLDETEPTPPGDEDGTEALALAESLLNDDDDTGSDTGIEVESASVDEGTCLPMFGRRTRRASRDEAEPEPRRLSYFR